MAASPTITAIVTVLKRSRAYQTIPQILAALGLDKTGPDYAEVIRLLVCAEDAKKVKQGEDTPLELAEDARGSGGRADSVDESGCDSIHNVQNL